MRLYRMSFRISIITATYNRSELLERAIRSVMDQNFENFEHIVIDNMSTDSTCQILARHPHIITIREPDRNLYEAWNKGFRRMTGDVACILNSDDELPEGAFARVEAAFAADPDLDMVSGGVELCEHGKAGPGQMRLINAEPMLRLREQDIGPGIPITNGRYLTRRLIDRIGAFDERYDLVSDRDFLLRVLLGQPRNALIPEPLYRYHAHAGSLTLAGVAATRRLAEESHLAASNGLAESPAGAARDAYRRWHAWTAFYLAATQARQGQAREALATIGGALRRDPLLPLRLPAPLLRHLRERGLRRGEPVSAPGGVC
jgi:glycosyltransferase